MLDFPASPALNQQFSAGNSSWVWDGTAWNIIPQMVPAVASDTPPANPAVGQFWWRASNGQLYLWYVDPSGPPGQWVQAAAPAAAPVTPARAWEQIFNGPVTNVGSFIQANLSAFFRLRLRMYATPASACAFYWQLSENNGSSWVNTAGAYIYQVLLSAVSTVSTGAASATLIDLCNGGTPTGSVEMAMDISNFNNGNQTSFIVDTTIRSGAAFTLIKQGGAVQRNVAANAMIINTNGPTFSGHIVLEGVRG